MTIQTSKSIVDTLKPFRNELLNKPKASIFTLIKIYICDEEPNITQDKLVKLTSIPRRTLQRIMSDLQGKGMLVREGGKRFGHWKHSVTNAAHRVDNWPEIMFSELATNCMRLAEKANALRTESSFYIYI